MRSTSPRTGILLGGLLMLTGGAAVASWFVMQRRSTLPITADDQRSEREALASLVIPEFDLVDQDGSPRTREFFKGRLTILAFTFTHCPTACPIMNSHLIRLQEELKGIPVHTVSITVDPAHDTPAALKTHADALGIDTARWTFLTGEPAEIERIVAGLKFGLEADPSRPITLSDGQTMTNILHPTKLLLIGPDAAVAALEDGLTWEGAQRIARLARAGS